MEQGTVKFWNEKRGFGFVTRDKGGDIFCHVSQVEHKQNLEEGDTVSFSLGPGQKNEDVAVNVKKI